MIDHFGLLAPFYDRVFKYVDRGKLASVANLPVRGRLLDAAGGTGRISRTLYGLAEQVVVSDLSLGMLRQAAGKDLETCCSKAEYLPFPAESFDRIIMVDALHHVVDQSKTARELWRVLKVGGKIVIVEPDIRSIFIKVLAIVEKAMLMRSRFLADSEMLALFPEQGMVSRVEQDDLSVWIVIERVR